MTDDLAPWHPPGRRVFVVGDRVVCRPSPECRQKFRRHDDGGETTARSTGHWPEETGQNGVITACGDGPTTHNTHKYRVAYDHPIIAASSIVYFGYYAAAELELRLDA